MMIVVFVMVLDQMKMDVVKVMLDALVTVMILILIALVGVVNLLFIMNV